jgi:hypothetical protein
MSIPLTCRFIPLSQELIRGLDLIFPQQTLRYRKFPARNLTFIAGSPQTAGQGADMPLRRGDLTGAQRICDALHGQNRNVYRRRL